MRHVLLAVSLVVLAPTAARPFQPHTMLPLESLSWRGGATGVSTAIAEGDPAKAGAFTMMLKLADGAWLQPHWHHVDKRLYVIKGELLMGTGDRVDASAAKPLGVGGTAVVSANTRHFEGGRGETIIALSAIGPFQTTFVKAPASRPGNASASTSSAPVGASASVPFAPAGASADQARARGGVRQRRHADERRVDDGVASN